MSYRFLSESRWPSCPDSRTHSLLVKTSSMTGTSPGRNHLSVRYTGTEKQVQRHCENGISVMNDVGNLKNDSLLRRKKNKEKQTEQEEEGTYRQNETWRAIPQSNTKSHRQHQIASDNSYQTTGKVWTQIKDRRYKGICAF